MSSGSASSKVKCRVIDATDNPSNPVKGCSSNSFAIRPVSFSSITSSMDNPSTDPGTTAKAGDLFTVTIDSKAELYNGEPKYNTTLKDHNNTDQVNQLTGTFSDITTDSNDKPTGEVKGTNFKYAEVGLLNFAVNDIFDDSFTSIDYCPAGENPCTIDPNDDCTDIIDLYPESTFSISRATKP